MRQPRSSSSFDGPQLLLLDAALRLLLGQPIDTPADLEGAAKLLDKVEGMRGRLR